MNGSGDELQEVPWLARLAAEDVRALAAGGRRRTFAHGEIIFREGSPGDSMHVVLEGQVRCVITSADGNEITVATMGQGEAFGDMSLLDGRPRSTSAIASGKTLTFQVSRELFVEWLSARPAAALALLEELSIRIRRSNESLNDQYSLDLGQRLAKHLLTISAGHNGFKAKVTQAELASRLGVTRESINKQLNVFERQGWVLIGRGSVTVTNADGLRTALTGPV
jgi:CRP-like cAMP-binding protein